MAAKGMKFPWRWTSGTISTNLDVIFGCHLGNVGLTDIPQITVKSMTIVPHGTPSQLEGDIPAIAHDHGPDLEQLLSQRSAANALLPPIRLTSSSGQNRKSSVGLGMSGVGGRADIDFGPLDVCS